MNKLKDIKQPTLKECIDDLNNKTIEILTRDLLYIKSLGLKIIYDDSLSQLSWPHNHHKDIMNGYENKIFYIFSDDSLTEIKNRIENFYTLYNKPNIKDIFKNIFDDYKHKKNGH